MVKETLSRLAMLNIGRFRGFEVLSMDIRPIRNDTDHEAALREIESLWGAEPGTPDGDRLDVLITLADAYEDVRWSLPPADPVEAIRHSMEMQGRTQSDLAVVLGSAS